MVIKIEAIFLYSIILSINFEFISALKKLSYDIKCGQNVHSKDSSFRVVNGERAGNGEFPWQISFIINGDNHVCGGSIIAPDWVLTAAHCVWPFRGPFYKKQVVAGALVRKRGYEHGTLHKVTKEIMHEKYNSTTNFADIALLKINPPFVYRKSGTDHSSAIGPICLPKKGEKFKGDAIATGFGRTQHKGNAATYLMSVKKPIQSGYYCSILYNKKSNMPFDRNSMICCGALEGGRGTCQGDSGGALVYKVGDHYVQIGIVSYGRICGGKGAPTVYTDVAHYREWISKHAKV